MKRSPALLLLLIAAILAVVPIDTAFAKELLEVKVSGPGLDGSVKVTDPEALRIFRGVEVGSLLDAPPTDVAPSYFELRLGIGYDETLVAIDVHHYYPPTDVAPGYMYYAKAGTTFFPPGEGLWYPVRRESDRSLRALLLRLGATETILYPTGGPEATALRADGFQAASGVIAAAPETAPPEERSMPPVTFPQTGGSRPGSSPTYFGQSTLSRILVSAGVVLFLLGLVIALARSRVQRGT